MADRFPGPYRSTVPDSDPLVERVPFTHTDVGARKSILPTIKNGNAIRHTPNMNSK